eukprot:UN33047
MIFKHWIESKTRCKVDFGLYNIDFMNPEIGYINCGLGYGSLQYNPQPKDDYYEWMSWKKTKNMSDLVAIIKGKYLNKLSCERLEVRLLAATVGHWKNTKFINDLNAIGKQLMKILQCKEILYTI